MIKLKLEIDVSNEEYEKLKLILIFNKSMHDFKRGSAALEKLDVENEDVSKYQETFIPESPEQKIKKIKYDAYMERYNTISKALEKLDNNIQMLSVELLEKYNISTYGKEDINLYEFCNFKLVEVE